MRRRCGKYDSFSQQEETKAIRMKNGANQGMINPIFLCLTLTIIIIKSVINEVASLFSKKREKLTIFQPKIKMFTTFIVLAALVAACYPLALVCAAQNQQLQSQQVFRGSSQSSHNIPSQINSSQAGDSLDGASKQQLDRRRASRNPARVARSPVYSMRGSEPGNSRQEVALADSESSGDPIVSMGANRQQSSSPGGSLEMGELPVGGQQLASGPLPNRPPSSIIRNVTAQNGQSVLLHCLVEPSSELVVSWFRGTGEPQLLTYESNTVIDDQRFVVRHGLLKDDDWALQIKNLDKATDSGLYQCQTNSEPPQSQFYQLNVIEPQVNISGAPDMAVKLGSAINLTCIISQSPDQLQFIFWYRNDRMINYDINERGKIVISKWAQKPGTITSNLQIFHSKLSDSGNYTCSPSGARPMSIYLHVLEGLDKRLTMFQNDNYEPSAASSQQTNSALSVHVVRLSKGRVYALFLAYVIFASWFQLVTQAQTAISFLLLAIIGFFLGKVTGDSGDDGQLDKDDTGMAKRSNKKRSKRDHWSPKQLDHRRSTASDDDNEDDSPSIQTAAHLRQQKVEHSNGAIDPLIRRANSALNLLKSLSSESSSNSSDCDDDRDTNQDRNSADANQYQQDTTLQEMTNNSPKAPLNSPSGASTSSSFASTGYNSDSRSTNLVLVHNSSSSTSSSSDRKRPHDNNLADDKKCHCRLNRLNLGHIQLGRADDTCEMIELVTEPTAMSLIMDEFGHKGGYHVGLSSLPASPLLSNSQATISGSLTPIKPPRLAEAQQLPVKQHRQQLDSIESHYSSPTNSLAYPKSKTARQPITTMLKHSKSPSLPS